MNIKIAVKSLLRKTPDCIKNIFRPIHNLIANKYNTELDYWRYIYSLDGDKFSNDFYEKILLGMSEEPDDSFLTNKIVADFGCGPRGTLTWARNASVRIGIDVLVDKYLDNFKAEMLKHNTIYLKSTENCIPLPTNHVDVMFTLNAFDHVSNFAEMCNEVKRVIKKGGEFLWKL